MRENIILALQARRGWAKPLSMREQVRIADRFVKALDIRTTDIEKPIRFLSGGNQQKAILARWLATEPRFLILDEPTRGIDVGAHAEIVRLIETLCEDGMAMLVISSELDEITTYANRVRVLRDRRHLGDLTGEDVSPGAIMRTIAGTPSEGARHDLSRLRSALPQLLALALVLGVNALVFPSFFDLTVRNDRSTAP